MTPSLFIEIIDDNKLCVYDGEKDYLLSDTQLAEHLQSVWQNSDVVLLDSLFIQSKIFTQAVRDKSILPQVIAAELGDYLLKDMSDYRIRYHHVGALLWVSWIENSRYEAVKKRFLAYQKHIKGLVSTPLLIAAATDHLSDKTADFIAKGQSFSYVFSAGQTAVMHNEQATVWQQSIGKSCQCLVLKAQVNALFQEKHLLQLPNLWQQKAMGSRGFLAPTPSGLIGVSALLALLFCLNSYLSYRQQKQFNQSVFKAQQQLLQKHYPQAKTPDPHGWLLAASRSQGKTIKAQLRRLNAVLNEQPLSVSELLVDDDNKTILLKAATISEQLAAALRQQGFILTPLMANNQQAVGVKLTWQ